MPVYHILLFKVLPIATPEQVTALKTAAKAMVGQVPGLMKVDIGEPLVSTAHRAQGFDMGLVALLEKSDDVAVYAKHPSHVEVHRLREEICGEAIVFDLEY